MSPDPPLAVIARARGALIEFIITGDGEDMPDTIAVMSVEAAAKLRLDIVDAILDAKKAKLHRLKKP